MNKSLLYFSALAGVGCVFTPLAYADDAYVCDGGRLVYARPETLEKLKQTDPCIASYYPKVSMSPLVGVKPLPPGTLLAPTISGAPSRPEVFVRRDGRMQPLAPKPTPPATRDAALELAPSLVEPLPQAATATINVRVINAAPNQAPLVPDHH